MLQRDSKRAVLVEHVGDAAAHAGREVAPGRPEDHRAAAGHVLAAVVADALDDGARARVAHREALAGEPAEERAAGGRAVEHGVADQHVLLGHERGVVGRADGEHAAGQALARVVVGVADQRQLDARRQPRAERLPGRAAQREADRLRRQPLGAVDLGDRAREQAADRAVDVADRELAASPACGGRSRPWPPRSASSRARPGAASPAGARAAAACPRAPRASSSTCVRSTPRAFQCSIASSACSRSTRPIRSSIPADADPAHDLARLLGDEEEEVDDVLGLCP